MSYKYEHKYRYPSDYTNDEESLKWVNDNGGIPDSDYDFKKKFPIDFAVGLRNEKDGITTVRNTGKYADNIIVFKISSWVGISAGARHIYGNLEVPGVSQKRDDGSGMSTYGRGTPDIMDSFNITITKKLDQETLDYDANHFDPQFNESSGYYLGDDIRQWEQHEEDKLKAKAQKVFDMWFGDDWVLKFED